MGPDRHASGQQRAQLQCIEYGGKSEGRPVVSCIFSRLTTERWHHTGPCQAAKEKQVGERGPPVDVRGQEAQHIGLADHVGDVPLGDRAVRRLLACSRPRGSGRGAEWLEKPGTRMLQWWCCN